MSAAPGVLAQRALVHIENLPGCALDCLSFAVDASGAYQCGQVGNNNSVQTCVYRACLLPEAIFTRNATELACGTPVIDHSQQFLVVNIVLGLLTAGFVALRLGYRLFLSQRQGLLDFDDLLILIAAPIAIASLSLVLKGLWENGAGRSVWGVTADDMDRFGVYLYIVEILYLLLISLVKMTLTIFYLAIFPGRTMRRLLWGTMTFHVVLGIAFCFKGAFQCSPVSWNWMRFRPALDATMRGGHCVDINASGWVNASANVAVDFWLIAIPLFQIRKLNLHWKKKIGAALMFMTGLLVTIVSILRLNSLRTYANSSNPTYDDYGVVLWSVIEVNIGLICTCLPTIRLLLFRLFPTLLNDSQAAPSHRRLCEKLSNPSSLASSSRNSHRPSTFGYESDCLTLKELPKLRLADAWPVSPTSTAGDFMDEEAVRRK